MDHLRFGVIGLGVGERLAHAVAASPGCSVAVLCDFDPDKLASVSAKIPGARTTASAEDVLADKSIDVAVVASWDNFHFAQTKAALLAGKHVFVEKPFVVAQSEAQEIRALLAERPTQRLSSNLVLRATPRFVDLRRRIVAGELGRLYHLEGDYEYGRLWKITEGWRGKLPFFSAVHSGGVHVADLLMWLAGDRVESVSAFGNTIASSEAGASFRNFDMVVAALRFQSGAVGKLGVNFGCVRPHYHRLAVYGTKATFENRPGMAEMYSSREQGDIPAPIDTEYPGSQRAELIKGFIGELHGRAPGVVGIEDVFASMSVCFAIEKSAHAGVPVRVAYL